MDDMSQIDALARSAVSRRPDVDVAILPRADGQYSNHATDTLALLEEAGVIADYATDPFEAGVHAEKSADVVLPPLLVIFSDAANLAGAIDAVAHVILWFLGKRPSGRVSVDVFLQRKQRGASTTRIRIRNATSDEAIRLLREAGQLEPPT
jgi:hypothetical protein